jgi:ribosomal protein S27AE
MSAGEEKVDVFCKNCGTTFSAFLQQMAEHNQRIVCPKCGQAHTYNRSDLRKAGAGQPHA